MPRTAPEIEAEIASKKAAGVHQASREMVALRAELKALTDPAGPCPGEDARDDVEARKRAIAAALALPIPPAPISASDDVAFVNEALAQLVLKGQGSKPEKCYSDIRSALAVKHLIEDAAGLTPAGRLELPHWDKLGRDRDTGLPFKPGENQAVVDGLAQRAVPVNPRTATAKPSITTRDGQPISLSRSRALDEPEGNAAFVTVSGDAE